MSNTPAGASRSEHTPRLSPVQPHLPMQPNYRTSPRDGPANPPVQLPPLRQLSSTPPTPSERRNGNPFGVHSMLNPQAELAEQQRGRRRSASQMESASPVDMQNPYPLPSVSRPTSADSFTDEHKHPRLFPPPGRPPRHILSPKSPKLHRTQSLGLLNRPTGTIDAHQSPFLTSDTRPSDPVTLQSALPTPPMAARPSYFTAAPPAGPPANPNMIHPEARQPSMNYPQTSSATPMSQYSPYSQSSSVSTSQYDNHSHQGHYAPGPGPVHPHDSRHGSISMETERNSMIPMAPSGQSSIQLMTIKSQHGHPVQIPVDVQAASKVADEKRRRNAGASARFRARRKEKEREASISISRLEQQLREAIEDAEYYRTERDYFKNIALQQPNSERHYARPPSPRLRRCSVAPSQAPSSTTGAGSDGGYGDYDDEPREEERNVRRRTSTYYPASGPPPSNFPTPALPPVQSVPFGQPYMPHSDRPIYRNPFGPDNGRYESTT